MKLVILESPFRANQLHSEAEHIAYAKRCVADCIRRGESPYASHLIIPGALDDNIHSERMAGIVCGYAWWDAAEGVIFYLDYGWSEGMKAALLRCVEQNKPHAQRYIGL